MQKLNSEEELRLKRIAVKIRKNVLRMIKAGGAGHIGGALSCTDILTALYFKILRVDPQNPTWPERDRFVLSAGHKCLALYGTLAEKGFFDSAVLDTYGALCTKLGGHPDMHKLPGIESNTGALGHGLSISGGMAMGLKMDGLDSKVYVILGDGELAEGSNWEAAAAASHHKLDNLVAFVDRNKFQHGGRTVDFMSYEPLDRRWEAFGWAVRVIDGNNLQQIYGNVTETPFEKGKPSMIIADTIKAKGLPFMEDKASSHYWKVTDEEMQIAEQALQAIEEGIN
ncbi:Transketolase, N-terminal section (EC [Olavius sp. associated proteobacterium Delta 1]|nr:Transketolase, N-terminal section (EC [Olavius sp. associated proteobacterium Delta 1]